MSLTQSCLTTHIKNIQCLYKDLADKYLEKLKLGKVCKEAEWHLLMLAEYLETFYCYEVPEEYINMYRIGTALLGGSSVGDEFTISNISFDLVTEDNTYTITLLGPYSTLGDGGIAASTEIREGIEAELEILGFNVTSTAAPYIYFETDSTTFEDLTLENLTYTVLEDGNSDSFGVSLIDNGSVNNDDIDEMCLTPDEVCCIIQHSYTLLKDCNCS